LCLAGGYWKKGEGSFFLTGRKHLGEKKDSFRRSRSGEVVESYGEVGACTIVSVKAVLPTEHKRVFFADQCLTFYKNTENERRFTFTHSSEFELSWKKNEQTLP
jgi:hypothetical protein